MKRSLTILIIAGLMTIGMGQAFAADNTGKLGVGIDAGLLIPAGGDITADSSFSDFFKTGASFGLHMNYTVAEEFALGAGFDYAFMKMNEDVNPGSDLTPYFSVPYVYFDGTLNLGSFMNNPESTINPYLTAGGGLYFWKMTEDGAGGDAIVLANNDKFSATSFGLNFGAGLEIQATPDLAIFAEGKYHMIFSEDKAKFGNDFGNLGMIGVNIGLTYYLPLGSK